MDLRYSTFTFDEFLTDPYFISSVRQPTRESDRFWREFLVLYPEQESRLQSARNALRLLLLATEEEVSRRDREEIWERIAARKKPHTSLIVRWRKWAAAAALAVASVAGWQYLADRHDSDIAMPAAWPLFPGSGGAGVRHVLLPDQTEVTLAPGSELRVDPLYDQKNRGIALSGEAEFEVTRNESKPFRVYSSGLVTQVLGTRFRIRPQNDNILVDVTSGKVSVFPAENRRKGRADSLILTRNQRGVFQKESGKLARTLVDNPLPGPEHVQTVFRNAKMDVIFQSLEKAYGVEIRYDAGKFDRCRLTTSLPSADLKGALDILCAAIGASYQTVDAHIVITSSSGCL